MGELKESPLIDSVAAVSVGLLGGNMLLDLAYIEDKDADVDFNIVMTGQGRFVEVQGTGEEAPFSKDQPRPLIPRAKKGRKEVSALQAAFRASQPLATQ